MAKGIEEEWKKAINSKSDYTSPAGENLEAASHLTLGTYYRLCPGYSRDQQQTLSEAAFHAAKRN